jgi:hydroxymethylpyrimidine pyrophosphatase-like HAD family hydrolase
MYCRVIACDFDGTGASDGHPAPEVYAELAAARERGIVTLLVTGRVLEDIQSACEDFTAFDAVVAENGAVVHLCKAGRTVQIGSPPPEQFLGELRSVGVPFHTGGVVVGTWEQHSGKVFDLIRRFGLDSQIIFNRAALMILPSGINKAVGIRRALEELGRSERNLVAFGDAENDIPMLRAAEIGVAARASVKAVLCVADTSLTERGPAGVAHYISELLESGGMLPPSLRRTVPLGKTAERGDVTIPTSGTNLVISGDPRSGKSWIAGLLAERLIEDGYRICVIDPEGDYAQLGEWPKVVTFGHDLPLPGAQAVARLLSHEDLSIVLSLSELPPFHQQSFVSQLLASLQDIRAATGIPHWLIIDEAHYFFQTGNPCLKSISSRTGNFCLVTYRPSLLANEIYAETGAHILTSTKVEEERYFVTKIFQPLGDVNLTAHAALSRLETPMAGLLKTSPGEKPWQFFIPAPRITSHAHHARKYSDYRLPEDKAFRFLDSDNPVTVHNIAEFYQAIQSVSQACLRHHLQSGDFSRWVGVVLGDEQLARGLKKIERSTPAGASPNRAEILAHIEHHYQLQPED